MSDMLHQRVPRQEPTMMMMTLLERFDRWSKFQPLHKDTADEIRRALAIAQAVDEYRIDDHKWTDDGLDALSWISNRADELLLEGK